MYWKSVTVHNAQRWIEQNFKSIQIDFDELIIGKSREFGFDYTINTVDQHEFIENYVTNIDEVRSWYQHLENDRNAILS